MVSESPLGCIIIVLTCTYSNYVLVSRHRASLHEHIDVFFAFDLHHLRCPAASSVARQRRNGSELLTQVHPPYSENLDRMKIKKKIRGAEILERGTSLSLLWTHLIIDE